MIQHPDRPDDATPFVSVEVHHTRYTVWFRAGEPAWIARFATAPHAGWPVSALAPDSEWAEAARQAGAFVRSFSLPTVAS